MSEGRSADWSYLPSDIGTDVDDDDAGVCPDNPEEDTDTIHLLQVKAVCVDESGEASYLSGFIGIILFKVWKEKKGWRSLLSLHRDQWEGRRSRRTEHSSSAHL